LSAELAAPRVNFAATASADRDLDSLAAFDEMREKPDAKRLAVDLRNDVFADDGRSGRAAWVRFHGHRRIDRQNEDR
jgi:hypothetical protein